MAFSVFAINWWGWDLASHLRIPRGGLFLRGIWFKFTFDTWREAKCGTRYTFLERVLIAESFIVHALKSSMNCINEYFKVIFVFSLPFSFCFEIFHFYCDTIVVYHVLHSIFPFYSFTLIYDCQNFFKFLLICFIL